MPAIVLGFAFALVIGAAVCAPSAGARPLGAGYAIDLNDDKDCNDTVTIGGVEVRERLYAGDEAPPCVVVSN